jgi:hypothetical protein
MIFYRIVGANKIFREYVLIFNFLLSCLPFLEPKAVGFLIRLETLVLNEPDSPFIS